MLPSLLHVEPFSRLSKGSSRTSRLSVAIAAAAVVAAAISASPASAVRAPTSPDFASSFESADPQPFTNTPETLPNGNKKASGVTGTMPGIPGSVMDKVTGVTANGENPPSEVAANLIDGDVNTKWLTFSTTGWARLQLSTAVAVQRYALTSANDASGRDPKNWQFQGSQDGTTWTTLDTQSNQSWSGARYTSKTYDFSNSTPYLYYRLNITANNGDTSIQLSEFQISDGSSTTAPGSDMRSAIGNGPISVYNAKSGVGWTGLKAFRYAGSTTVNGHAYAYNKVFDVDVPVSSTTRLSYVIFPEFTGASLARPSTYAAVDLAFSDGTYLSDLGARDQHGFVLSPDAQGLSKSLYVQQWNFISSNIGTVAAGKTIKRILVGYDNPNATDGQAFQGWIDDVTIVGTPPAVDHSHLSDWVDTRRGTNANGSFSRGNNIPATAVPHGFNFWVPMTDAGSMGWLYEYQAKNNSSNLPAIQAFEVSHEPSPWMGDRQTFQVMPSASTTTGGLPDASRTGRALVFRHSNEVARPYFYGVTFDNGMKTEIAPTDHAAIFRFTFLGNTSSLIFDNVNNNGGVTVNAATGEVTGYSDVKSGLSTGATRMFVYAVFDKPIAAGGPLSGGGGANVTGYAQFDTTASKTVTMRIATSLISVDQAKHNLGLEIPPTDTFEAVEARAQQQWDDALGVVTVEGGTDDQLTTLYSNLYRVNLYPNSAFENTGTADAPVYQHAVQSSTSSPNPAGTPTATGATVANGKVYVNNGFWDTYRTVWAAYSLLYPRTAGELTDGFVQQYIDGGWIARWSSPGYANLMDGTSSDVSFADAFVKGVTNFRYVDAYDAALKNAAVAPPNANVGRKGLATSIFLGYTPTSTGEGFSWAMDGYINDFGIANMSKALYDASAPNDPRRQEYLDNYTYYLNRAQDYVNLFDPSINFFQGRTSTGAWRVAAGSFDPRVWGNDYTETDAWNMAFTVPQDGQGLANLYGGKAALAAKLDQFFATPETAQFPGSYTFVIHEMVEARDVQMGQYGHSNQPSHHILYMYDYAGQPWKTQAKVREALSRLYIGSEIGQGYPGDEDNGEMSAWYVLSALGLYPLQMGSPYYAIGSPLFTKATIHFASGHDLVINAPNNSRANVYVQSLNVNGQPWNKTYLPHSLISDGGVLDFTMGAAPSSWGTAADSAPISITQGSAPPRPLADTTGSASDTKTGSQAITGSLAALFDNSSSTPATFLQVPVNPFVQYHFAGGPQRVTLYTLTSGSDTNNGDPKSWTLSGSNDGGTTWTVVDQETNQTFPWRVYTRAFSVSSPGSYSDYKLEITANTGQATTALAEIELLGVPAAPTAVGLRRFEARAQAKRVVVRWRMASEARVAGYDVFRTGPDGRSRRLNSAAIRATAGVRGASHTFVDRSVRAGRAYTYRLRIRNSDGTRAFGPARRVVAK